MNDDHEPMPEWLQRQSDEARRRCAEVRKRRREAERKRREGDEDE